MRPTGTGGKAKDLTTDEVRRIVKCLAGTRHELRDLALFHLGLGTGCRIGELAQLRVGDVANAQGKVLAELRLEKHSTKSKRSRTVFLSEQAQAHLQRHVDALREQERAQPGAPVFAGQRRPTDPMSANVATNVIARIFRRAGVQGASSHSLRRTFANTLLRQGADLYLIKELLGHSSLTTTAEYFQVDPLRAATMVGALKF